MPKTTKKNNIKNKKIPDKMICQNLDCDKSGKEQPSNNFYDTGSELLPKYPICKDCVQKIIDIDNIQTVYKVLQEMNKPFFQEVWTNVCIKTPENPFGSYIRQINSLPQYKNKYWKDSIFDRNTQEYEEFSGMNEIKVYSPEWSGYYTKKELDYLNNYYQGLHEDFKIITTNHKDYARKIAQASLAANKAFQEMSDGIAGAEKKYKDLQSTFDTLSKSAQFSESQRGINDVSLGCFGVIFDKVEQKMYVKQHQPMDKDMYDKLLDQFANINKSL